MDRLLKEGVERIVGISALRQIFTPGITPSVLCQTGDLNLFNAQTKDQTKKIIKKNSVYSLLCHGQFQVLYVVISLNSHSNPWRQMVKDAGKETVQEGTYLPQYTQLVSYRVLIDTGICLPFLPHHTAFSVVGMKVEVSIH